jgi:hypothetical protein
MRHMRPGLEDDRSKAVLQSVSTSRQSNRAGTDDRNRFRFTHLFLLEISKFNTREN